MLLSRPSVEGLEGLVLVRVHEVHSLLHGGIILGGFPSFINVGIAIINDMYLGISIIVYIYIYICIYIYISFIVSIY